MGVTVHYRGKIDDLDRVEDFQGRVIDQVLLLGGNGQICRSANASDSDDAL